MSSARSCRLPRWIVFLAYLLLLCSPGAPSSGLQHEGVRGGPTLAITNGLVFTATGTGAIRDGVVLIRGNRIEAVGLMSDLRIPGDARILDARGGFVMPGLINAHVHHAASAETRALFLGEGVTAVCDLGSPWEEISGFRESHLGSEPVARGFYAGPFLAPPGGYPGGSRGLDHFKVEATGVEAVREAVHILADSGAHYVKVALDPGWNEDDPNAFFSLEEARAIVSEAHGRGLRVRSHSIRNASFPFLVEAGVQVAEHLPFPDGWPPEEKIQELMERGDPLAFFFQEWHPQYDGILQKMVDEGVVMVPTLAALLGDLFRKEDASPREEFVEMAILGVVRRFREKGGTIALGNDYNGRSGVERLPESEIQALLDAGLTPEEVLIAGTRAAAWVCGQEAELGTLEPGKMADLLVLTDSFLEDPGAIHRIRGVVMDGVVVQWDGMDR